MGFFNELEENLEKYVEKLFGSKGNDGLQPVDIARRLGREMRRRRRAGLKGVYVPNRYAIYLKQKDFAALEPLLEHLAVEMTEYIAGKAREKKYILAGPVKVEFAEEKESGVGEEQVRIETAYDQPPAGDEEHLAPSVEDTLRYVPPRESAGHPLHPARFPAATLETKAGTQYMLDKGNIVLGRRETCDIFLMDNGISRKHAAITRRGNRYVIRDLGSTNGTLVNGARIADRELESGDVIILGDTELTFKVV
ncbi:MAG: FHA domain-containing protein [Firmicutes bacterium]|nr:FHA domain-containing protein [Bacillota bacterium]